MTLLHSALFKSLPKCVKKQSWNCLSSVAFYFINIIFFASTDFKNILLSFEVDYKCKFNTIKHTSEESNHCIYCMFVIIKNVSLSFFIIIIYLLNTQLNTETATWKWIHFQNNTNSYFVIIIIIICFIYNINLINNVLFSGILQ